jgi:hypothetical protein
MVSSVQLQDLKRLSQPFDNEIFAFAGPVDDKKSAARSSAISG